MENIIDKKFSEFSKPVYDNHGNVSLMINKHDFMKAVSDIISFSASLDNFAIKAMSLVNIGNEYFADKCYEIASDMMLAKVKFLNHKKDE